MAVREVLLHVGGAKCGSTSLQTSFSAHSDFRTETGARAGYGAFLSNGRLLLGRELARTAAGRITRSVQCHPPMRRADGSVHAAWTAPARAWFHRSILLSREAWGVTGAEVRTHVVPRFPKARIRAILFVRPQVEHANSAWWQWGAWTGKGLDEWLVRSRKMRHWGKMVETFRSQSGIEDVTVRLLSDDIVGDCLAEMDCARDAVPTIRANAGLPGEVLRLYQRHPETLRPEPGAGVIDVFLRDHLRLTGRAPWVIGREAAAGIVAAARPSNERLLAMLDADDRERMRADPRWWDPDAYADRAVEDWRPQPADAAVSDALVARLVERAFADARAVSAPPPSGRRPAPRG